MEFYHCDLCWTTYPDWRLSDGRACLHNCTPEETAELWNKEPDGVSEKMCTSVNCPIRSPSYGCFL